MNAQPTNTLLHAYGGEKTNLGLFRVYMTDSDGNKLTDNSGNYLIAQAIGKYISNHAQPTNTLLHAED